MQQLHRYLVILGLAAVAWAPASCLQASIDVDIQITGLNFTYDESQDGSLYDAASILGRTGNLAHATPSSRVYFYLGGERAGPSLPGIYVDFLMRDIYDIPKDGGIATTTSSGPAFGFDLISPTLGCLLSLNLDTVSVNYSKDTIGSIVQFSFVAGGPSAGVVSQNLPNGLVIDPGQLISVRVSSQGGSLANITTDDNYILGFNAVGGVGTVHGVLVPEPTCFAALLCLGVIGLEFGRWKRSRAKRRIQRA